MSFFRFSSSIFFLQVSSLIFFFIFLQVSFANAKGNAHTLVDEETRGVVLRRGRPVPGDGSHAREGWFSSGHLGPAEGRDTKLLVFQSLSDLL